MSTVITAESRSRSAFRPSFYFWMTLLMAFFVFGGFSTTYWYPMAAGTFQPAPPVVHLHGFVYFTWIILLLVQSSLANAGNVRLHRTLGMYGIAHATAVIFMGTIVTLLGASNTSVFVGNHGIILGILAVTGFAFLFTLALRHTRQPDIHRRLMLFAMLPILPPGIHRLYMAILGTQDFPVVPMYITLNLMAIAIIVHEWRTSRAINLYTWIGVGWLVLQQILHAALIDTEFYGSLVRQLGGLMYYR